jgi:acetyl esterase/lipase
MVLITRILVVITADVFDCRWRILTSNGGYIPQVLAACSITDRKAHRRCRDRCSYSPLLYVQLYAFLCRISQLISSLTYTALATNAPFPTQLCQFISALNHLFATGVHPQNIHLVGDSAGANLILQLFSHTLHPLPADLAPPSPLVGLSAPIKGAFLMSPWVSLASDTTSFRENDKTDVMTSKVLSEWGTQVIAPVPESSHVYLEAVKAPESWFAGVNGLVHRILITTGAKECLRDDDIAFADMLDKHHPDVKMVVQEDGVHDDPLFDFALGEPGRGSEMTQVVVEWLLAGCNIE